MSTKCAYYVASEVVGFSPLIADRFLSWHDGCSDKACFIGDVMGFDGELDYCTQ